MDGGDSIAEHKGPVDLAKLGLAHGEGARLELPVERVEVTHIGEDYTAAIAGGRVRVDVSRTTGGWAFRLRYTATVSGPCARCTEPAEHELMIETREVEQPGQADAGDAEEDLAELTSPYVSESELDYERWTHDALALAMPPQFLCRADCAGLCPECGVNLNELDPEQHRHERPRDPRFAALDALKRG